MSQFDIHQFIESMEEHLGDQDGPARPFWKAFSFSVDAHQNQKRKSGEAYISHPCLVVKIIVEEFGVTDPETLAAAILHDTVEDVEKVTNEVIGALFGPNVEAIVDGCTKVTDFSGDRKTFHQKVHRKLFAGAASRIEVMLIKLADRLHNMRTLDSMPRHKRQKIAEETLTIYAPMAKIMGLFELKRELYDLALRYKFPRQSHKIEAKIQKIADSQQIEDIGTRLRQILEESWITADIYFVAKGLSAYFDPKKHVLSKETETPMEIILSVADTQTCYSTLGIVNQIFPPIPRTIRDFIANPKPSGYQSLHARANIKGNTYLFKFRTDQMYEVGRVGIVKMWLEQKKVPTAFEEEIKEIFNILGEDDISYADTIAASGHKEIYTFTPKGERVCLPLNSTVLDFAFKVHTEVGRRCFAAVVGSRKRGPEYVLHDGDRVKVLTRSHPVEFEPEMQQICQSAKARSNLAKTFRRRRHLLAQDIGLKVLLQEMKRYGLPRELLEKDEMVKVLEAFEAKDLNTLYQYIGTGVLPLREIIVAIKEILYTDHATLEPPTGALNQVFLESLDPACIKLSRCCSPIPTEKGLFGLLNNRGLSVHRKECKTLKSLALQREDVVALRWNLKQTLVTKPQTLLILNAASRNRVMMMLGVAPLRMKIQEVIYLSSLPDGKSAWEVNFTVDTLQDLKDTLNHFDKTGIEYEIVIEQ